MNRSEFIIATAIVLFVAFLLGWFAYWLLHRFSRSAGADMSEVERMARELHEAEEIRDQAIAYYQAREAELVNRLQQAEAELRATMDGLREARAEAEGLKDYVERSSGTEPSTFATMRTPLALTDADAEHEAALAEEAAMMEDDSHVAEASAVEEIAEPARELDETVADADPEDPAEEDAQDAASDDAPKRGRRRKEQDDA